MVRLDPSPDARRSAGWRALAAWLLVGCLSAQDPAPAGKEDEPGAVAVDPYTGGDAKLMASAGVVAYAPFPWADGIRTADIDRVLGDKRVLWLETAHFRIGSSLKSLPLPQDNEHRKQLLDEIKELRGKLPKVPERPKRLDPWLRLHLCAQRAEAVYADFLAMLGRTDKDFPVTGPQPGQGAFLGMPDKYLLLVFQKPSDLSRYLDRFCGLRGEEPTRHYHLKSHQLVAVLAAEGMENFDDRAMHRYIVYALVHNLLNGYQGYRYPLPLWLAEGVAHWFSQQVESNFLPVQIKDDEAVDQEKQHEWARKVRRRAQHERGYFPFATMLGWLQWKELGYHHHVQSWSRVDYLMSLGQQRVGELVTKLKQIPQPADGSVVPPEQVAARSQQLVQELWSMDPVAFDKRWREWVLKTYPKK